MVICFVVEFRGALRETRKVIVVFFFAQRSVTIENRPTKISTIPIGRAAEFGPTPIDGIAEVSFVLIGGAGKVSPIPISGVVEVSFTSINGLMKVSPF